MESIRTMSEEHAESPDEAVLSVSARADVNRIHVEAAAKAGLAFRSTGPELDLVPDWDGVFVILLDATLVTTEHPMADWRLRFAANGASTATIILVVDDIIAALADDRCAGCDDLVGLDSVVDVVRALTLGRARCETRNRAPESRTRLREIVAERLSDVIFQLASDLRINYVNPAWSLQLGYESGDHQGRSFLDYIHPASRDRIGDGLRKLASGQDTRFVTEADLLARDGRHIWMEMRAMADPFASGGGVITGLLLDVSSRDESDADLRESHERYRRMALQDPLTGLANRLVFADRLQHALDVGERREAGVALLFVDLDGFKPVNDTYGHSTGDRVLANVAARLTEQIRPGDTIARYGGDEFAVILEDLAESAHALLIANRLIESMRAPIKVGLAEIPLGISIGITILTGRKVSIEEAVGEADHALYRAKLAGRSRYSLYESNREPGRESLYHYDLRRGIQRGELTMIYLPIFDLATRSIIAIEGRIRWDHPDWGRLEPDQFLRRADANELMGELGREALGLVARDLDSWAAQGLEMPQVRVAITVWQALDTDLVGLFTMATADLGLPGDRFAVELMEGSSAAEREAILPALDELRALGLSIGFDNVVTGNTPLAGVVRLKPDYVNIYADTIDFAGDEYRSRRVIEATRMLGEAFDWSLVAKDVDTPKMLAWLESLGVPFAQGQALTPGMSADEVASHLRQYPTQTR